MVSLIPFEQKKVSFPVTELVNREREKHQMHSKMYYDLGEGFCEEHTHFMQRENFPETVSGRVCAFGISEYEISAESLQTVISESEG